MKSTNKRIQRINEEADIYILAIVLLLAFLGCIVWVTVAEGAVAMIPTILAIFIGVSLVDLWTDNIKNF